MVGDILTGIGALGTGIGALGNIGVGLLNYSQSVKNLDYQKSLQQQIFNREDTALQRRMADAEAAGLNPYSVIGSGGAASGSVVKTDAPQLQQMNFNGLLDTVKSILDIQQGVAETKRAKALAENESKTGLILDADLLGKNWQNKILGLNFLGNEINLNDSFLNSLRNQAEFNYDFGTDWHYKSDETGKYDYKDIYSSNNNDVYGRSGNPWYGRQNMYDLTDTINYGILSDYWNNWYNQDMQDTYSMKSTQRQLLEKQNNWYNWNKGFDMASDLINGVTGILFKKLDLGLRYNRR